MKVLITGTNGFVAKNLRVFLSEQANVEIVSFTRSQSIEQLDELLVDVDFVFHLAGVNRPKNVDEFGVDNTLLTSSLCQCIEKTGRRIPVIYSSSIQAELDTPYGRSKHDSEQILLNFSKKTGSKIYIFRLPNVFGKWCKPNYNSAVATFCHNIAHDLTVNINDPSVPISLVYVDDVVREFIAIMGGTATVRDEIFCNVTPVYNITVGELVDKITEFKHNRSSLLVGKVGSGLERALHASYLSYLGPKQFTYELVKHEDPRGVFVEILKTEDSGQFSYFTAHPGITRGGHYHHTKTEKFLVVKGHALFKFSHVLTYEYYQLEAFGDTPMVVETVPGWSHDITNIGDDEMVVMLWANEIFDSDNPDTFTHDVE